MRNAKRTVVTGATGLVGKQLLSSLPNPVVLTRSPGRAAARLGRVEARQWDPMSGEPPLDAFAGATAVVHLAGEAVAAGRWSDERKRSIRESRVKGTRNLVAALARLDKRPSVLVCASATGIYGDRGDEILDESSDAGEGFLAEVCSQWEAEAQRATELGIRVVNVRTGIVLAAKGGALAKLLPPFKLGAGGRLGDGKQWMSWIHIDDVVGLIHHAIDNDKIHGAINAVAPNPVTNKEFTHELAHSLHRPALLPIPKTALRLLFGQMSEVMLTSQRVHPRLALETGYHFQYPDLASALESLHSQHTQEAA